MGIGMGIIIVKTLQSHSPRLTIAPLRGPTHTRPGNLDLFFMKNCGVRGLSSHKLYTLCHRSVSERLNPLHYVLLAGIDAAPSSGYDLTLWLANLGQHFWAAEHSSIYPALRQLQTAGFVMHREQLGEKGQTRKIYRLTTSGRQKLKKWVDESSADAQVRDEQMVKVLCFDLLSRERITEHLQRIREYHAAKLFYYED